MKETPKIHRESILALLNLRVIEYSSRPALSLKENGEWRQISYQQLSDTSCAISEFWIEQGFQPGERIAILSESCPEWAIAFFAAVRCGAIVVPLDAKLTGGELATIVKHAEPKLLFVSPELRKMADELQKTVPTVARVLDFPELMLLKPTRELAGIERTEEETALIVYTSGTTGAPKGVRISFGNLIFQVETLTRQMGIRANEVFLSMLPLNHLLELTGGLLCVLFVGGEVCYSRTLLPQDIVDILQEKKVAWMVTVPLFLKLLKGGLEKQVAHAGAWKREAFAIALGVAELLPGARATLFREVHKRLGGNMRGFISGGARLDIEIARFFDRIGIPVYQGYGLTETSPVISVNDPQHHRAGTVGRPVSGVEVRIDRATGEILTRGPHIMQGYYKNDTLSRELVDSEGWLHTGDRGYQDNDGYLVITGRIKNLIVLGGGKKVQPEEVEAVLSRSVQFKETCVLGVPSEDGNDEICAVIVPGDAWREGYSSDRQSLRRLVEAEVWQLSRELAPFKRPLRIMISSEELPKTSSRKIRRPLVKAWVERLAGKPE